MDVEDKGTFYKCTFTRMFVMKTWIDSRGSDAEKVRNVLEKLLVTVPDPKNIDDSSLCTHVKYLCKKNTEYWKKSNRTKLRVISMNSEWLHTVDVIELPKLPCTSTVSTLTEHKETSTSAGRKKIDFADSSKRTKQRRLAELSKIDQSAVQFMMNTSSQSDTSVCEISCDEVLSLINEAKLTKHQYILVKEFINSKKCPVLPSYHKILEAKKRCYPKDQIITESLAEVDLQSLLDHTAQRIIDLQKEVFSSLSYDYLGDVFLLGKWGFDGSTGHSEYKQSFVDQPEMNDGSLFVTSYVPLLLVSLNTTSEETVLWKNPRPSSTRYCCPIRFRFAKETKDLSIEEEKYFKEKIKMLQPTTCTLAQEDLQVHHILQLTMVDGKICSALSETSSSRCYLCGATPKEMNLIDSCLKKEIDATKLEFGLSPLHSWIRFFEYLIHVAYKLDIKKWQARSAEEKALMAQKKNHIQSEFKKKLGLIVDKPRSGGSGTSNDGNTARKFFENSAVSAEITGIKKDLIIRCGTILKCLASGYKIYKNKFKEYALETARQLVHEYPWYNLPASVHKVLIHGSEVIEHAMLPIGELSEEAAESTNKNIKLFRLNHTRKMTRITTNTDLLNRLLLNSDPLITGLRKLPCKQKSVLSQAVLNLLEK